MACLALLSPRASSAFGFHIGASHGGHHYGYHGSHHGYYGSHHSLHYGSHYGSHYGGHHYYGYRPYYGGYQPYYRGYRPNYGARHQPYAFTIRPQRRDYGPLNGRRMIDQSRRSDSRHVSEGSYARESSEVGGSDSSGRGAGEAMAYPRPSEATAGEDEELVGGWALLADRPAAALAEFAREATNNPTRGLPKAGYAIAQAMLDNDARAIWAMRRALEFEAHALHYAPLDKNLDARFGELIAGYRSRLEEGGGYPGDDRVMIAALAYMRHDYEVALPAAAEAVSGGDRRQTTQVLLQLIKEQLAE